MFQQPIDARFASEDTEADLRAGFDALADAIGDDGDGTATEVFWGALHGMSLLERAGRMRPEHRSRRVAELAVRFAPATAPSPSGQHHSGPERRNPTNLN